MARQRGYSLPPPARRAFPIAGLRKGPASGAVRAKRRLPRASLVRRWPDVTPAPDVLGQLGDAIRDGPGALLIGLDVGQRDAEDGRAFGLGEPLSGTPVLEILRVHRHRGSRYAIRAGQGVDPLAPGTHPIRKWMVSLSFRILMSTKTRISKVASFRCGGDGPSAPLTTMSVCPTL